MLKVFFVSQENVSYETKNIRMDVCLAQKKQLSEQVHLGA